MSIRSNLDAGQIIKDGYDDVTRAHNVVVVASVPTAEGATVANGGALPAVVKVVAGYDGSAVQVIKTNPAGEIQADIISSALPTGAATEASLSSLNGKVVAVNTGAVVVASSALPTGAATSTNQTNKSQYTHITDGTDDALVTAAGELNVLASAQPGTDIGDVTINNAAGVAAVNIQDGGNSLTVDATDLDIRDLSSASDSVSAVVTSSALPAGASTGALQTTGNTSLASIDTKTPSLGQALAAASVPVVLTAAQLTTLTPLTTVAATQSGTWNINNVSGTVSLPTGASTEATLSTLSTNITAKLSGSLVPFAHDYIALTYVTVGNGIGEIETAVYKSGGAGGSTVATLTLAYDSSNRISSVTKS